MSTKYVRVLALNKGSRPGGQPFDLNVHFSQGGTHLPVAFGHLVGPSPTLGTRQNRHLMPKTHWVDVDE